MKALVLTWNAGASTPNSLRYSDSDAGFIQNLLQSSDSPDVLVFSFQELVDLEDKTATAKRLLKPKKKEGSDQERMSHQYRDWRDFLVRSLDDYMAGDLYHLLLPVAHLVGLFTCVFVKADLRGSDPQLQHGRGEARHGRPAREQGAPLWSVSPSTTRPLCFVNCHLAAGQSQANHRHTDIAAILESAVLPIERDLSVRLDNYVSGGDGTMILDHELCVLNGDLNYRVDTMSRDTVVAAVKANNLAKLLERDQLLVARRRNPGFRLRAFEELAHHIRADIQVRRRHGQLRLQREEAQPGVVRPHPVPGQGHTAGGLPPPRSQGQRPPTRHRPLPLQGEADQPQEEGGRVDRVPAEIRGPERQGGAS